MARGGKIRERKIINQNIMSERGRILEFSSEKRGDPKKETENSIRILEIVQVVDPSKEPVVLARCELVGAKVKIAGDDENVVKALREEKILWGEKEVTPDDGEDFLRAVKASYRNPYLFARKIK